MDKKHYDAWATAMLMLSDTSFFDVMHLYLGAIQTPFNKQRLIEQLSGFLMKPEISRTIVEGLSEKDVLLLTAVNILNYPSANLLHQLFAKDFLLTERLINMEGRLLIYRTTLPEDIAKEYYCINPVLEDCLKPLLHRELLFQPTHIQMPTTAEYIPADDITLAALYCFFRTTPDILRKNGTFKKKAAKTLQQIFPSASTAGIQFTQLYTALIDLGLLLADETTLHPQEKRWIEFFKCSPFDRKMYLAAAAGNKNKRKTLPVLASLLSVCIYKLDTTAVYSNQALQWFFFITLYHTLHTQHKAHIFSSELEALENIGNLFTSAQQLGYFIEHPHGYWQLNTALFPHDTPPQPIIVSPTFEITIMPYTNLADIFPVFDCVYPLSVQATGIFTLTRNSCIKQFENGMTDTDIISILEKASGNSAPQNIRVSISEWYAHSTAIGIYCGCVIYAAKEKREALKNNRIFRESIYKELADGVYLIRDTDIQTIHDMAKQTGLNPLFYNTPAMNPYIPSAFQPIESIAKLEPQERFDYNATKKARELGQQHFSTHTDTLHRLLADMAIANDDKRILEKKINQKLIISKTQLNTAAATINIHEVSGLDFLGKINLAEKAIADNAKLEIYFDNLQGKQFITGNPVNIKKIENDALLLLHNTESNMQTSVSIAQISRMILIQNDIFFENY